MIPKVIHCCWISGDPYPEKIQMCIDSWKKMLPDYQIMVWNYEKVHAIGSKWCEQAIETKKYAFAADFIRFYALFIYGGIYFDSDVEVLKPIDELLKLKYFIGKESTMPWEPAVMGAEPGIPWIGSMVQFYRKKSFVDKLGKLRTQILPWVMENNLNSDYLTKECSSIDEWFYDEKVICRFPQNWFSPWDYNEKVFHINTETYTVHHFTATWQKTPEANIKLNTSQKFLKALTPYASFIKHKLLNIQ